MESADIVAIAAVVVSVAAAVLNSDVLYASAIALASLFPILDTKRRWTLYGLTIPRSVRVIVGIPLLLLAVLMFKDAIIHHR